MPVIATDATVLHSFDYQESSRICKLATRDAGLQSVLARGARGSKVRFGSSLGLFVSGTAVISVKEGRDLHTLDSFDVLESRVDLAGEYSRFLGASVVAELLLRFSGPEVSGDLYSELYAALDELQSSSPAQSDAATLASLWRLMATLGFSPTVEVCATCHRSLDLTGTLKFHHRAGGVLCPGCEPLHPGGRHLPADARAAILGWIDRSGGGAGLSAGQAKAHARLFREFAQEHMGDGRPLHAYSLWEGSL